MSGFIRMDRAALDHPLLQDPMRFRAWLWLLAGACWKPTNYDMQGRTITLQRGQMCVSIRQMADAWGMSKSAVDRFLTRLETETMIEREAGQGKCIITICNYAKYQDAHDRDRDTSGTPTGTPAGHQRDIKEQGNKGTIEPKGSERDARDPFDAVFDHWNAVAATYRLRKAEKKSTKRRAGLRARLKEHSVQDVLAAIDHIPRSRFLRGLAGNWAGADLDFFLTRQDTITRTLEGAYDDRSPTNPRPDPRPRDGFAAALDDTLAELGSAQPSGPLGRCDTGTGEGFGSGSVVPFAAVQRGTFDPLPAHASRRLAAPERGRAGG